MDYIEKKRLVIIVKPPRNVRYAHQCSPEIIQWGNAEKQHLEKINQINEKVDIILKTGEHLPDVILKTGERLKDFVLSHIPDDDIRLLRSPDLRGESVFIYHPTEEMNNGRKVYELDELEKSDESFERWFISKFEKKSDGKKALKALFTDELHWSKRALSLRLENMKAFNRVGYFESEDGEVIYISLRNYQEMVEITRDGVRNLREWNAPVWFMQNETMRGIATPQYELDEEDQIDVQRTISHLNDLRKYVNVNKEDFCLIIAWLFIALRSNPIIDAPILWIKGKRSSGKSTSTRFLKRLIDPDISNMLQQSVSTRDFSAACNNQYVFAIDNVSSVTPRLNEMLCEAVTAKKSKVLHENFRRYFTCAISAHNNIIVNSLDTVSMGPELQTRCFTVETSSLNKDNRKTNEELEASFRKEAPYILGALLVALSFGLKNRDYKPELDAETRLVDACRFVARVAHSASESGLPFTEDDFIEALRAQSAGVNAVNEARIEDNVVAQTIYEMAREKAAETPEKDEVEVWSNSTGELLKELRKRLVNENNSFSELPRSAQKLRKILSEISGLLSEVGINVDRGNRESTHRFTRITYTPPTTSECNVPFRQEVNIASETKNDMG